MLTAQMDLKPQLTEAIKLFWSTRETQAAKKGAVSGVRDSGKRAAVTGGAQMNGFVGLVRNLICSNGLPHASVYCERAVELPGWYRPEKKWDLLIVHDRKLLAAIEFKSQIGSFGNNYNNRTEEAIGSAVDLWGAFREGAFRPSERPWLGYLMLLEEAPGSMRGVTAQQPHFPVFSEFVGASYARRYEILLTKLVRERLYDGACFLMSTADGGPKGEYSEPSQELTFHKFSTLLLARVIAASKLQS